MSTQRRRRPGQQPQASTMAEGPSPIIPFLLVATLGFLLHGNSLKNNASLLSDSQDAIFSFVLVIPLLVLLLVYYTSQSIIAPLALLVIVYTIAKVFLGPLILIGIIYLVSVYTSSLQAFSHRNYYGVYSERDGSEGWGAVLLVLVFLALHGMLVEGEEGRKWCITLLVMLFYVLYNLSY